MDQLQDVINLRRTLHRYPELSNREFETAKRITAFMEALQPDRIVRFSTPSGTGRAFVFVGKEAGPAIAFRCELDALPIQEKSTLAYRSSVEGVAHLCGHDGHMAVLCRLGQLIAESRPPRGKAILLFQPAEESYLGAMDVVESPEFHELAPDYIFALHNIPGAKRNVVLVRTGSFSAASCGMTIRLEGRTSHAAQPELGLNPWFPASKIIEDILALTSESKAPFQDRTIATLIYTRLGEISFGVSPGSMEFGITLRAYLNEDLELLREKSEAIVRKHAEAEGYQYGYDYCEIYPATVNDAESVEMIRKAAADTGLACEEMKHPNHWSEDFAYFTATNKGAQFGFGSGEDTPPLHHPSYDFPDEIIDPAARVFFEIYKEKLL